MMDPPRHHDLFQRILVNGAGILLVAFFIFIAANPIFQWIFPCAVASVSAIALWEYYQLVKKKGILPPIAFGLIAIVFYIFAAYFKTCVFERAWDSLSQNAPEMVLWAAFLGCFIFYSLSGKPPIIHIATTFLGIVYIGVPLGLIVSIMCSPEPGEAAFQGSWWIVYLIAVTKSADMGGYFIGRRFGRHKLALRLSPNKTLEGALGGLGTALFVSLFICYLGKQAGIFSAFSYIDSIWLGLLVGAFGQMGDLAESLLKRDAHVKDSNHIPGVGGILDMIDSLLFTAPLVYIYIRLS